jgi:hypothetical protein
MESLTDQFEFVCFWWINCAQVSAVVVVYYIVICIPITRQRLGKHIPAKRTHATIGRQLIVNGPVNTACVFCVGRAERL